MSLSPMRANGCVLRHACVTQVTAFTQLGTYADFYAKDIDAL